MDTLTQASDHQPTAPARPSERLVYVDVLRGFAVLGILIANMASYSGQAGFGELSDPLARGVVIAIWFLVTAKFYSLFSFLFGWGLALQMRRAQARQTRFWPLYLRRLVILLMFGLLHASLIWSGDILTLYALLGFLLLLLRRAPVRLILSLSGLCLILAILMVTPGETLDAIRAANANATAFLRSGTLGQQLYATGDYWTITRLRWQEFTHINSWVLHFFGNVFSMFLLGLYAGRRELLERYTEHLALVRRVWLGALLVGVAGNAIFAFTNANPGWLPAQYVRLAGTGARTIGAPALTLFYVTSLLLLYRHEFWRSRLEPLAAVGRMALSNYIFQSLLATLLFYGYGLGLYGETGPLFGLALSILIYLFQIRLSQLWLENHAYGPLEWLWRLLTYGRLKPPGQPGSLEKSRPGLLAALRARIPPVVVLLLVWILLCAWGAGLLYWQAQLRARAAEPLTWPVRVTATPAAVTSAPGTSSSGSQVEPVRAQAKVLADRRPGMAAEAGDALALAQSFSVAQALPEIEALTGPPYLGRQAGSPQGAAAGDYLADAFERAGLLPAGENGTYFQNFSVNYTPLGSSPVLALDPPGPGGWQSYQAYRDFSPIVGNYAGSGGATGPVTWVDDCGREDFMDLNVVAQIVLCRLPDNQNALMEISRRALEYGAAGLFVLTDPDVRPPDLRTVFREVWVPAALPTLWVYPNLVEAMLAGGTVTLEDLLSMDTPVQLETIARLEVSITGGETCPGPACPARNVLGVLPGRDPAYAHQVIILGAHYDHMGEAPPAHSAGSGTVWAGANDNASGVAALLEIARSWQAAGYQPRRTVLFAAWDAEELGLLGSYHYTRQPAYPLEDTLAMIQLDMVGAPTSRLTIAGEDRLAAHLAGLAEAHDLEVEFSNTGRSDHTPFLEAGVPASLLIWFEQAVVAPHYHRPADTLAVIDERALEMVGEIAALGVLDLAESEPAIRDLVAGRAQAVLLGERQAFLDTSSDTQRSADGYWWQALAAYDLTAVNIELGALQLQGAAATAQVDLEVAYQVAGDPSITETLSADLRARFVYTPQGWRWDGPALVLANPEYKPVGESRFRVLAPAERSQEVSDLAQMAAGMYAERAGQLGLPTQVTATLALLPSGADLRASVDLTLEDGSQAWVAPGEIRLVDQVQITTSQALGQAVAQLILAEAGLEESAAPWLWNGLPWLFAEQVDLIAAQERLLPNLTAYLSAEPGARPPQAADWAALHYFWEQAGWSGLGDLIRSLGVHCQNTTCRQAADIQPVLARYIPDVDFEAAWRASWQVRLQTAQAAIDRLLDQRAAAVLGGDQEAFLASVDAQIPALLAEQMHWFERSRASGDPLPEYQARPVAFLADGSLLVALTTADGLQEVKLLLSQGGDGYLWAGAHLEELPGEIVSVRYPPGALEQALAIQSTAAGFYQELALALDHPLDLAVTINLYATAADYQLSLGPQVSADYAGLGWTAPGEGIKLPIKPRAGVDDDRPALAELLTRHILLGEGVEDPWLLLGVSLYLQHNLGEAGGASPALALPALAERAALGESLAFANLPDYPQASAEQRALAWDAVRYCVNTYGWQSLQTVLAAQGRGLGLDEAVISGAGLSLDALQTQWLSSLQRGHISPDWPALVAEFDTRRAEQHLSALTDPGLAGRQAGMPGERLAAVYIARQMRAFGLQPFSLSGENTADADLDAFLQSFPISMTRVAAGPRLSLRAAPGLAAPVEFDYRADFLARWPGIGTAGHATGKLLWAPNGFSEALDARDRILLMPANAAPVDPEYQAALLGAKGVLLYGGLQAEEKLFAKQALDAAGLLERAESVPVLELTQAGYMRFLELIGQTPFSLMQLETQTVFEVELELEYGVTHPTAGSSANVLAWLPGSDPVLSQEVIVLGAHYDHVGDDPGWRFSGANDNASGVATLLEIARVWQQTGYRPKRSVLFAAWGAQEMGELGSRYFMDHPGYPLGRTVAMFQLDGVGGGDGFNLGVLASWEHDGVALFALQSADALLDTGLVIAQQLGRSDHLSFREQNLPAALLAWRLADEHNLADVAAHQVLPERLGMAGRLVALAVMSLAQ